MIELQRIGRDQTSFFLNPSMVVSIEHHPDTTVLLATGARLVVADAPERVVELIDGWHAKIAAAALHGTPSTVVGDGPAPLRPV